MRRHLLSCPACRERLRASPFYPEQGRRETEIVASLQERSGCPAPTARLAFSAGALPQEEQATVAEHARRCPACAADFRAIETLRRGTEPGVPLRPGCLLWFRRR